MADKSIGELQKATSLQDDSLLVMEHQGTAQSVTGSLVKSYAVEAAKVQADAAKSSADAAAKSRDEAAEKAQDAADVALHPPKIQGGNWWTWDTATKAYVDSGVDASVSLSIAETVTGAPGDPAKVENVGTATDPKLKFTIPLGNQGPVTSVNGQMGDVVIGGRNLLLKSNNRVTTSNYLIGLYYYGDEIPVEGAVYTCTIKGNLGANREYFGIYNNLDTCYLGGLSETDEPGIYRITFTWTNEFPVGGTQSPTALLVFHIPAGLDESTIEWIKLERGNISTAWSPAPEDIPAMAPVQSVNGQTGDIVYSNANLVLNSGKTKTTSDYWLCGLYTVEDIVPGDEYTLVVRADLGADRTSLVVFGGSSARLTEIRRQENGIYRATFSSGTYTGDNLQFYAYPSSGSSETTIYWIKLIKGNATSDDWSPAPEDILRRLAALEAAAGITYEPPQIDGPEIMDDHGGGDGDEDVR